MPILDRESRVLAIQYVRRCERYRARLAQQREDILHSSPLPPDGQPKGGQPGDSTSQKAEQLARLEQGHMARVVRAVDAAKKEIGADILDERAALALRKAIWMSCLSGFTYSYEVFAEMLPIGRTNFYERKNSFLKRIVEILESADF